MAGGSILPTRHLLLLLLCLMWKVGRAERWDGVVITQADYQGLQAIKRELVDPRGLLTSWNGTGLAACSGAWVGIKCVRGEVIAIQLPFKALGGRISSKVGQLTALRKLSLHDNSLSGQVPSSLGLLPRLRGLYLFNNRLSGTIPSSLSTCPLLLSLDLSGNSLSGHIPSSLSPTLYRLNLSDNRLSGHIHSFLLSHPSLTFLSLHHNNLSGHIPASSDDLPLKTLHLDHNSLTGTIPSSLSNLTFLVELTLQGNSLTGALPESLTKLTNLTSFNVSNNHLSGPVPPLLAERFNSSSFSGNLHLCGYTPTSPCPSPPPPPPPPSGQPTLPPRAKEARLSMREIILIAAGSVLAFLLLLSCLLICCLVGRKRRSGETNAGAAAAEGRGKKPPAAAVEGAGGGEAGGKLVHFDGPLAFTADDLLCATAEIMGKSTYGTVYKATLEDGNQQVAVKRLRERVAKGQKEFESEVDVVGRIRHPNLLSLRAYYLGPKGEKLLVFDYMSNGSLASFLHAETALAAARGPETAVDWPTRMRIAIGAARGLHHLHAHENMVHGNLTSSNVLLDENLDPKIADFGLSRLMTAAANSGVIATAGALGYRAPELSKLKRASTKTDVYSLGVVILELLTGKSPSEAMDDMDLPQWVASIVKEEWTNEVFDLELMKGASGATGDELLNTLKLALHCVDPSPSARPEVEQVLRQLEEIKPELAAAAGTSSAAGTGGNKEDENGGGTTVRGRGEVEEEA